MIKKLAKAFGLPSLLYLLGVGLYNLFHPPDWSGPDFLGARLAGIWVGMIILLIGWPLVLYFRQK